MKKIVFMMLTLLLSLQIDAQEQTIALLRNQLEVIETEEKSELKKQIENINSMFENRVVSAEEAERLKLKAAEAIARKIEERQAVILETIAFLEKKQSEQEQPVRDPDIFLDIDSHFGGGEEPEQSLPKRDTLSVPPARVKPQPVVPLKEEEVKSPTTLDLVAAFGYNNAIGEGRWQDLEEDSDYALYKSQFLEIGLVLKTPLTKKNGLRLKYGLSFQSNGLRPTNNRYFAEVDGQTQLLQANQRLTASGFHVNNLVLPLHLEFGPTRKKQNKNYTYYSSSNQLKFGLGGYIGMNLSAKQWVELPYFYHGFYWIGREEFKGYDMNKEIYGLSAYAGIGAFSIYAKYDLNPIFENAEKEQQFVSLGLRLDL